MKNGEIANFFYRIADMLELQGVQWEPNAYRKAAQTLEGLSDDVQNLYDEGGLKALIKLPGIGRSIALHIVEYLQSGKILKYKRLKKKIPKGLVELMSLEGLGPKKVKFLHDRLGIRSISGLMSAIKRGRIHNLPGFGFKSEENIKNSLLLHKLRSQRMLLGHALPLAQELVFALKNIGCVKKVEIAGSLRRMKETVGDIDILAVSKNPLDVMDAFTSLPPVKRVVAKGPTKSTVLLEGGMQADLRVLDMKSFGAGMQYFTGSKRHNIVLRELAIKKGFKLNEYGLFKKKSNSCVAGRTERSIYKKLGLSYVEPELREDTGEIEAAADGSLPKLVTYDNIRGHIHNHTSLTDGSESAEQMIGAAENLGYEYVGISDHSRSLSIAHGLSVELLEKEISHIKRLRRKKKIKVLIGSEVDILKGGELDYPDDILKKLDFVIASVHSGFKNSAAVMTERILHVLSNRYVSVLGHLTGRLINMRSPYKFDAKKVFDACANNKVLIEINSQPARLDANDVHVRHAKALGCKFIINVDAHNSSHYAYLKYGVSVARRGWCESKDVANTLSYDKFVKCLKKKL